MRLSRCCAASGPVRRSVTRGRSARSPTWPSRPARCKTRSTCGWGAAEPGRAISPEHFGVSLAYAPPGTDLSAAPISALTRRARGRPLEEIIPVGLDGLRALIEAFLAVGFSKFVVRPLAPPAEWRAELEPLAAAVGGLQT